MNVRKPTDYSAMFTALNELMAENLSQMELYRSIGSVVSGRPEKGAAVAAAEYLQGTHPDATGFSPRSLRRMRDFYRTYENVPEIMDQAMTIGWTQNIVIMEADLSLQEKAWYIRAVRQFGWSKLELAEQIAVSAHLKIPLDFSEKSAILKMAIVRSILPARCRLMANGVGCAGGMGRLIRSVYGKYGTMIGMGRINIQNVYRVFSGDFNNLSRRCGRSAVHWK